MSNKMAEADVCETKQRQNRPHLGSFAGSVDSGYGSIHSSKSESDLIKMLDSDKKETLAFGARLEGKLSRGENGAMVEGKKSVGAFLTDIGGNLIIRGTGVCLFVPPGALQKQQFVYIRILPKVLSSGPYLEEEETCLTPIVECGPPGLQFQKKVFLTIPHCASPGMWQFTVHEDNQHSQQGSWETIKETDANIKNVKSAFTFEISHFTRYTVAGSRQEEGEDQPESQENPREIGFKWMKPCISMRRIKERSDQYEVRVQICNVEDIHELDASTTKSFHVRDTKESVTVTLSPSDTESNISISGDSQQTILFSNLWSKYQQERCTGGPAAVYVIQQRDSPPNHDDFQPKFKVCVCQGTTNVSMEVQLCAERDSYNEELRELQAIDEEASFLSKQPYYSPIDPTTLRFLDDSTFRKLCVRLDGNNTTGHGWEALAPLIGLKEYYVVTGIKCAADGERRSPSAIALNNFFKSNESFEICDTLEKLSNHLSKIHNHDARDLVEKAIIIKKEGEKQTKPSTSSDDVSDVEDAGEDVSPEESILPSEEIARKLQDEKLKSVESIVQLVTEFQELDLDHEQKLRDGVEEHLDSLYKEKTDMMKTIQSLKEKCNTLQTKLNGSDAKSSECERYIEKLKIENEYLRKDKHDLQVQLPDDLEKQPSSGVGEETESGFEDLKRIESGETSIGIECESDFDQHHFQ